MIDSSRTHLDILKDSLELIKELNPLQPYYVKGCKMDDYYCDFCQETIIDKLREEHKDDCQYYTLIEELEAWIRVEEEIENK
jgi:hypothetical protein